MSRLANKKKFGFVQLGAIEDSDNVMKAGDWQTKYDNHLNNDHSLRLAAMIASYIEAPEGSRFMTPCSGYGVIEGTLCTEIGIPHTHRWFAELHDTRGRFAKAHSDHVAICDSLFFLDTKKNQFGLAYINPPFDTEGAEQGGERYENQFLVRFIETKHTVVPGGIVILVVPQDVLAREKNVYHLARCYDDLRIVRLPDDLRRYREAIVFGKVREDFRRGSAMYTQARIVDRMLGADLPLLEQQATPSYTVPTPLPIKELVWFAMSDATPENAFKDVKTMGGAWASARKRTQRKDPRPLFPPSRPGAILGVASGKINNKHITMLGRRHTIKGTTKIVKKVIQETESSGDSLKTITRRIKTRTPFIVTIDNETGAVGLFKGDAGIAKLASITGAVDAMVDAYKESCPPVYNMEIPPALLERINAIVPVSGRALPGQKPGYVPMQKHLMAALYQGFTQKDDGNVWDQLLLSADMGCGKTVMAIGIAELLRDKENFTVIVTGPATIIGSRDALYQYDFHKRDPRAYKAEFPRGKPGSLTSTSQWVAEWRDLLPTWHTEILETPSHVRAFMERPGIKVGFISLSWLALTAGREIGTTTHKDMPRFRVQNASDEEKFRVLRAEGRIADMHAEETDELKTWTARQKKDKKKAQSHADVIEHEPFVAEYSNGISPWTIKRDRIHRCGKRRRLVPFYHFDGLYCPDCGRRLVTNDGLPHTSDTFYKEGTKGHTKGICRYCKAKLQQMSRKFDSVQDRTVPLFSSDTWNAWYVAPVPVITKGAYQGEETCVVMLYEAFTFDAEGTMIACDQPQLDEHGRQRTATVTVQRFAPSTITHELRRVIPWGTRPESNPRMALGAFISRTFAVDLLIADEIHKQKGRDTDVGAMLGAMVNASTRTLGLTGTVYDGKASGVFSMLQRLNNPTLKASYTWADMGTFADEMGIVEEITTQSTNYTSVAREGSGRADVTTRKKERAGITAELAQMIWAQAVIILLPQMGVNLPAYHEQINTLALPPEVQHAYNHLYEFGKGLVQEKGGKDVLSSWLQATLTFPYAPWNSDIKAVSKELGMAFYPAHERGDPSRPKLFDPSMILDHHTNLVNTVLADHAQGKRSIVFVQHTHKIDLQLDLERKIKLLAAQHGVAIKTAILRSKVKGAYRIGWFADAVEKGVNVVLCHPQLVDTGVNLIDFNRLTFVEPSYSLAIAMQAKKRHFRPTQTSACFVDWSVYENTMVAQAIDIITSKMLAASLLSGDDITSSMFREDDGMSLLQALARQILQGEQKTNAEALKKRMLDLSAATSREMTTNDLLFTKAAVMAEILPTLDPTMPVVDAAQIIAAAMQQQMTRWIPFSSKKKNTVNLGVMQSLMDLE